MYTIGEQHGLSTSSEIKTTLDTWYQTNLLQNYDRYISKTAIYCNDRTIDAEDTWSATGSGFHYSTFERLRSNQTPTFICSNVNDIFTASSMVGNGALTYPIGLITADEINYAGGLWSTNNSNYYIMQNASSVRSYWWTMSPSNWDGSNAIVFFFGGSSSTGKLSNDWVDSGCGVRPVISLKSCVLFSGGDGTAINPYIVELPSTCASVNN